MDPPGFRRREPLGEKPFYLTLPKPGEVPRKLSNIRHVSDYLTKENITDVQTSDFDFTKRKRKNSELDKEAARGKKALLSDIFDEDFVDQGCNSNTGCETDGREASRFNLENLLKSGVELDEKKILEETAAQMEIFRLRLEEPEFDDDDCD